MNVGLVQAIRFLPGRPERLADTYRNFVDEAVLVEDLGLDFVWTTEHHFAADGWMPAQPPVLSFIATTRFHSGWGVLVPSCSSAPGAKAIICRAAGRASRNS